MVYKTWCTIRQKLASFLWDASSKELVKIGEDEYYEERIIERDDKRYVLLRSVADPTAALVRRICEYYETIEDETELQGTLKEFKIQCDLTKRKSKNRCLAFIIAVVILTVAAIVGNSWLIRNWESSFSDLDMKKAPGQVLISQVHIHFLLGCKLDLLEADAVAVIELTAAFVV